jgi:hypothetical protein
VAKDLSRGPALDESFGASSGGLQKDRDHPGDRPDMHYSQTSFTARVVPRSGREVDVVRVSQAATLSGANQPIANRPLLADREEDIGGAPEMDRG